MSGVADLHEAGVSKSRCADEKRLLTVSVSLHQIASITDSSNATAQRAVSTRHNISVSGITGEVSSKPEAHALDCASMSVRTS